MQSRETHEERLEHPSHNDSFFFRQWYRIWIIWAVLLFVGVTFPHFITQMVFLGISLFLFGYGAYDALITGKVRMRTHVYHRNSDPIAYWLGVVGQVIVTSLIGWAALQSFF
ncbi:hypothetical protein [Desulfovibrio inopinatus]|uniref:hypothetical protein n=1 Tax=Desulfovibrio inopinatus TaxID=102109 RepID=UPI0004816106|nr:hypothetical protein [Desulfovibrio inopinatus]